MSRNEYEENIKNRQLELEKISEISEQLAAHLSTITTSIELMQKEIKEIYEEIDTIRFFNGMGKRSLKNRCWSRSSNRSD